MTLIALLDGTLIPAEAPLLRGDDVGVLRGDGVFEATLVVGGRPRDLSEHLARLAVSASMVELELPGPDAWRAGIAAVVGAWRGGREMALRLTATRGPESGEGPTCFVSGGALAESSIRQRTGLRVRVLARGIVGREVAAAPWLLAGAKTLSYAVNMAAQRYAKADGADDVIFVGTDGAVLEGPTSSVVVANGRTLVTPPPDGILDGITVRRLFGAAEAAGYAIKVDRLTPGDLADADGLWLASSVRLLAPVVAIDGAARPIGPQHAELGRLLQMPGC